MKKNNYITSSNLPKVQVLMSSYNGEKYIEEQIESIMQQEKVSVYLLVRDDGSDDQTVTIIKHLQRKYPSKIRLYVGQNLGYRKSFLKLFSYIDDKMDYYAYADQDDFWMKEKLSAGIYLLKKRPKAWLYSSALFITDEKLNVKRKRTVNSIKQSLQSFFIRTRLAGCTFVFTPELAQIATKYSDLKISEEQMPDHDCLLCMICMLYRKQIVLDSESYILHRRTEKSETSGNSIKKRFLVEYKRIFRRKHSFEYTAQILLSKCDLENIDKNNYQFLCQILEYNKNLFYRIRLCENKEFTCDVKIADILIRLKVLFGIY